MILLRKLFISLATLLVISTAPVACVNNPQTKPDSNPAVQTEPVNARLEARVLSRWDALISKDFEQAYLFFSPSYRKLFPLQHYLSKTGSSVDWISIQMKDMQFDGKRAEVELTLNYRLNLPMGEGDGFGEISKDIDEIWLWVDGEWWYTTDSSGALF